MMMSTTPGGMPIPFMQNFPFPSNEVDHSTANTHPAFRGRKLRAGKWLEEEEKYAELLISLFDQSQLSDCSHNMTLRAYMSQKLHCAPMRISKKYAGKGIGKLVYNAKSRAANMSVQQREAIVQRLKEAEDKFTRAAVMCVDQVCTFLCSAVQCIALFLCSVEMSMSTYMCKCGNILDSRCLMLYDCLICSHVH
jgi:hypothetical protein